VNEGFDAIKFYPFGMRTPGTSAVEDTRWINSGIDCVRAVRAAVGADVDILVDLMHQFVDFKQVRTVLRRLDEADLFWIEDPFVCDHPAQLAELRQAIAPRLAGGAPLLSRHEWRPLLEAGALDIVMPDVKWIGGIFAAQKLAAVADMFGVQVSPHNASGPVATAAAVHLSLNIPNFSMLEYAWGVPRWRNELCRHTESIYRGYFPAPQGPGLGVDLDIAVVARYSSPADQGTAGSPSGIGLPLD
jgi:galactonate dehydratase